MVYTTGIVAALVSVLAVSQFALATPAPGANFNLVLRQSNDTSSSTNLTSGAPSVASACDTDCTNMLLAFSNCAKPTTNETLQCACTDTNMQAIGTCMSCLVSSKSNSLADAQAYVDNFTTSCTNDGFAVQKVQVKSAAMSMRLQLGVLSAFTAGVFGLLL